MAGNVTWHEALVTAEQIAYSIQTFRYCVTALYVLQISEWWQWIEDEINLIQRARWSSIKIAYMFCRYYPFLGWPFYLWAILGNHSVHVCSKIVHSIYVLLIPLPVSVQTVIFIRTYAFTGRRRVVFYTLSLMLSFLFVLGIWTFTSNVHEATSYLSRYVGNTECTRIQHDSNVNVSTRTGILVFCACAFDVLCLCIVMAHCWQIKSLQGHLGHMFINQGIAAFVIMSAANLIAGIECFVPIIRLYSIGLQFSMVVNNLVACRLILELRQYVTPTESEIAADQSRMINTVIANLERAARDMDGWAAG
jgi:hypothetical protein